MKNLKHLLAAVLGLAVLITACKKSSSSYTGGTIQTPVDLVNKWSLDSVQFYTTFNGQTVYNTDYRSTTDYYDFRSNGNVYMFFKNSRDTANYEYVAGSDGKKYIRYNLILTDTIITLNSTTLILNSSPNKRIFFHK
ncbi:MAG: hypothetical protein EKK37_02615 [Sphingobacteriales bacterium]|nr:MAG: hypothetical protein EKK37_02615 [Sphingobacteriales bacterium]